MKVRTLNEWNQPSAEIQDLADELCTLSRRTVKDPMTRGLGGNLIRQLTVAFGFAEALKKNKALYQEAKDNYEELYLAMEDRNYHSENLGLDLLFNKKQFKDTVNMSLDYGVLKGV